MQVELDRKPLLEALRDCRRVNNGRCTLPILAHVLLEVLPDQTGQGQPGPLRLTVYDMEVGLRAEVPVLQAQAGATTVNLRDLLEAVKAAGGKAPLFLRDDEEAGPENGRLIVDDEGARVTLGTLPADEFPALPEVKGAPFLRAGAADLSDGFLRVLPCVSGDASRAILCGLLVKRGPEGAQLVATDSYRLAVYTLPHQRKRKAAASVIIPGRAGELALKLLPVKADPEVAFSCGQQQACFSWPGRELVTRLIEGMFPNYERVIPKPENVTTTIAADPKVLRPQVARVGDVSECGKVAIATTGNARLQLSADNGEGRSIKVEVEAEVTGKPLACAYQKGYLGDALGAFPVERIKWELLGALGSSLMTAEDYPQLRVVLMPMQP